MNLTNKIIILCFLTFGVAVFLPASFVAENLFFSLGTFLAGNVYVTVTALFMHAGITHLIMNMVILYFIGNLLEGLIGTRKFALVFFFGGMSTFLLSGLAYGQADLLVGCSGSIFTVMAVTFVVNPLAYKVSKPYKFIFGRKEIISSIDEIKLNRFTFFLDLVIMSFVQLTLIKLYNPLAGDKGVGDLGHLMGFMIGFVFGVFWSEKLRQYAKKLGSFFIAALLLTGIAVYAYYTVSHAASADAETFIDKFLSKFSIEIFQSTRAKCNNYCIEDGFDFGLVEEEFCTCKYNATLSGIII